MNSLLLKCGYKQIFYISNAKKNEALSKNDSLLVEKTFLKLEDERNNHRLSANYHPDRLRLDQMFSFSIVFDEQRDRPVFMSGVQVIGSYSARVFSRYFMFQEYRTRFDQQGLFQKIDDFETLQNDLKMSAPYFPFIFWSRDKGSRFFKKIKIVRPDIFEDWEVYPETVELLYKDNFQGLLYYKKSEHPPEFFINTDLKYKSVFKS